MSAYISWGFVIIDTKKRLKINKTVFLLLIGG